MSGILAQGARFHLLGMPRNYALTNILGLGGNYQYMGRGFRYGLHHLDEKYPLQFFEESLVAEDILDAFEKLITYCKKENIELICIQSALPPYRVKNENADDVHEYFTRLCNTYGVPFYDMNYLKTEYFSKTDEEYADLDGHMRGELAARQTKVLAEILNSENKDEFFYHSYDEVLRNLEKTL